MFKVTVAIACYNVENYIESTLKSIINQTFKDIEIICVDDYSTDSTLKILKYYSKIDNRIRVIQNKSNKGLAYVRNKSIKEANGDYIILIDGDDVFNINLVEKAYKTAQKNNSDIVFWKYQTFFEDRSIQNEIILDTNVNSFKLTKQEYLEFPAFTWIKIIKLSILKNLEINFPLGYTRQDIPVHWKLITNIEAIHYLPQTLSFYRQRKSATTHKKDKRLLDIANILDITQENLTNDNFFETYKNEFLRSKLNLLFGMLHNIESQYQRMAFDMVFNRISKDEKQYIFSRKQLRFPAKLFYRAHFGSFKAKLYYQIWLSLRQLYRSLS